MGNEVDRQIPEGPAVNNGSSRLLILVGDGDVEAFSAPERLEAAIEAYDLASGELRAFDRDGWEFSLIADGYAVRMSNEPTGFAPEDLARFLRDYMAQTDPRDALGPTDSAGANLSSLIDAVIKYLGA